MFCAHCTLWCFPSCQNDTIPLSGTFGWSFLFLWSFSRLFRFLFRISSSIRCNYALDTTFCARLPGDAMERQETFLWVVGCRSAMVSTSPATASSSSSAGCCGSVAVARSCFDLSLHRHSSVLAVLRQKTDVLSEREAAASSAPDMSSAGTHSEHRAAHSRKRCLMSPIALHPNLHFLSSRGIPCQRPSSISVGPSQIAKQASKQARSSSPSRRKRKEKRPKFCK